MFRKPRKVWYVATNQAGYLYRDYKLLKKLGTGRYVIWDFSGRMNLICLPTTNKLITVTNQEVLTKDNIALRFSFFITYKINDGEKFLQSFELNRHISYIFTEAEQRLQAITQVLLRDKIMNLDSRELNEKRREIIDPKNEDANTETNKFGITIESISIRDITFPKNIQDLFAKQLEAKIRAQTDLENARSAVATARALKNAAELIKEDPNLKFFHWLETLTKIADKGKHTFVVGDVENRITHVQ